MSEKILEHFLPKIGQTLRHFLPKSEKILVVLSPEIRESCRQKAEEGIPPSPPRSRRRWLCLIFS
jgi:hypothetical protein